MKTIPNDQLTLAQIPAAQADFGQIAAFALTFDGYEHWGSFEACAQIAEPCWQAFQNDRSLPPTLTELRTCLFFEQRRWRHYGYAPDAAALNYFRALVTGIRARLSNGAID
jgi:hypothetical protein